MSVPPSPFVIAGFIPATHGAAGGMGCRDKPGNDKRGRCGGSRPLMEIGQGSFAEQLGELRLQDGVDLRHVRCQAEISHAGDAMLRDAAGDDAFKMREIRRDV